METIHSRASLSRDPRLEVGETTGKKREAYTIDRTLPIQPFADLMKPQAVRFTDIIPESAIDPAMF